MYVFIHIYETFNVDFKLLQESKKPSSKRCQHSTVAKLPAIPLKISREYRYLLLGHEVCQKTIHCTRKPLEVVRKPSLKGQTSS